MVTGAGALYIDGILEDSTFKVSFISYKPLQLFDGQVHRFQSVYSHRFEDGSYLLVATEYSKVWYMDDENPDDYSSIPLREKPSIASLRAGPARSEP